MKKNLKLALWIFILWLAETVFLRYIKVSGVGAQFLYVFTICVALLEKKPSYYITIALICGLFADAASDRIAGFYLLIFTCTMLAAVGLGAVIYKEFVLMVIPFVLIFTFLENTLYFFVNNARFDGITYALALKMEILPVMLYDTVTAIVIYPLLKLSVYKRQRIIN